jgi:polyisoprenoid-binding protein YceI
MNWQIDPAHSHIQFSARHMMITTVRGRFENFSGTVDFDEDNPENSTVHIEIDAASINTREEQRDNHLRSADFLHADRYPVLTFTSKRIELIDEDTARVTGDLTIRDVTREITLRVDYQGQARSPWGTTSAGFSASAKINRKDFNLTWNQALETGGVLVGEEIKIDIELEIVKQAEVEAEAELA